MSEAAKMVQDQGADLVDINMGCPAPKVVEKGGGAALLRDPQRVFDILKAVRSTLTIPLTIKMRAGWSQAEANYLEIGRIAEDCGVDGVFFHPRFRIQGFSGNADWAMIGRLKAILRTPVIGNGDVASPADAEQMLKVTGCDGIMIGRASRGSPWIFSRIQAVLEQEGVIESPSLAERKAALEQHLGHIMEANDGRNRIVVLRMQAYWYTKGLPLSRYFHDRLKEARESRQLNEMIDRYFESIEMRSEGREGRRAGDSQQ
jgi:nifR3 family TIM-barrel protein